MQESFPLPSNIVPARHILQTPHRKTTQECRTRRRQCLLTHVDNDSRHLFTPAYAEANFLKKWPSKAPLCYDLITKGDWGKSGRDGCPPPVSFSGGQPGRSTRRHIAGHFLPALSGSVRKTHRGNWNALPATQDFEFRIHKGASI